MGLIETGLVSARSSFPAINSIRTSRVRVYSVNPSGGSRIAPDPILRIQMVLEVPRRRLSWLTHGFRTKGLAVTDITATEWCEKNMEFVLLHGKRKVGKSIKTGSARHAKLEEEVVTRVKVDGKSIEDRWALKHLNFMTGINQLLFEGLTHELPLIGFAEAIWMVGVIDEIQIPATETQRNPLLVDTKTRVKDTLVPNHC